MNRCVRTLLVVPLLAVSLAACGSDGQSDMVKACFEAAQSDPKNVDYMPDLPDAKIDITQTNAVKSGRGYVAVGKAKSSSGIIEFGCELDSNGTVTSTRVGPEGSIDTGN